MKDITPIKRHQALLSLSRDHHFGLLLVWKIKRGLDLHIELDRVSNYVIYFFEQDLRPHFQEEEQMLFPKLPANNPMRQRAEKEHTELYALVDQIKTDKLNDKLLRRFSELLKDHIRFEERELFGAIQQMFTNEELENMTAHDNNRSVETDVNWHDAFWNAKAPMLQKKETK